VFLVAAEPSGDRLGGDLARALRRAEPGVILGGAGLEQMAAEGLFSPVDLSGLAVLGLFDGLKAYGRVVGAADAAAASVRAFGPDAVVLIDSWGFTLRVAQRLQDLRPRTRLVKYVGPQVWATRPGRARTLAAAVDHLICIHAFETPYYAPFGLTSTVCGNPVAGSPAKGDGAAFRGRMGWGPERAILAILPGSRRSEIRRAGPIFIAAARLLKASRPDLALVLVAADAVRAEAAALAEAEPGLGITVVPDAARHDVFAAATAAMAASGTITTEIALQGAPVVVGYKLGWLSWALARAFLYKAPFATLMNVAAGVEAAPEFLQTRFTPQRIAAAVAPLLDNPAVRASRIAAQERALDLMGRGGKPAADIAAEAVIAEAGRNRG
jgi:lipid-A-disaccharide synthase